MTVIQAKQWLALMGIEYGSTVQSFTKTYYAEHPTYLTEIPITIHAHSLPELVKKIMKEWTTTL